MAKMSRFSLLALSAVLTAALGAPSASAGIVAPVEDCGGPDKLIGVKLPGHKEVPPYRLAANQNVTLEEDFVPAASHHSTHFTLVAETAVGELPVADGDLGPISGGVTVAKQETFRPGSKLVGKARDLRFTATDGATVEFCVKVTVTVVAS